MGDKHKSTVLEVTFLVVAALTIVSIIIFPPLSRILAIPEDAAFGIWLGINVTAIACGIAGILIYIKQG